MLPTARAFAIICAIVLALSTSTSAATATDVVLFSPWSSSGLQQGFTVSENVKGHAGSTLLHRNDPMLGVARTTAKASTIHALLTRSMRVPLRVPKDRFQNALLC